MTPTISPSTIQLLIQYRFLRSGMVDRMRKNDHGLIDVYSDPDAFAFGPDGKRSDNPDDTVFTRDDGAEFTRGNACYWREKWSAYLWGFGKAAEFYSKS